jgi:hypothetical protein
VDDVTQQDEALGPVVFEQGFQTGHRRVASRQRHQLPPCPTRPSLPEVQVGHREASAARQPHGAPSIKHRIVLELKPFSHHVGQTLAPARASDEAVGVFDSDPRLQCVFPKKLVGSVG